MGQKTIQTYETAWNKRIPPVAGIYTGERAPNQSDCPTGCSAVDFMLSGELPLTIPTECPEISKEYDEKGYMDHQKSFQAERKAFWEKTSKNNGNPNLGNFDSNSIISAVRDGFNNDENLHFYGNNEDSETDFLMFIKHVLALIPSTPSGQAVKSVLKKAMGANYGSSDRLKTPLLELFDDGNLNIYQQDYLASKNVVYTSSVTAITASLNRILYPAIAPNPASALPHEQAGALIGSLTWADAASTPRNQVGSRKYTTAETVIRRKNFETALAALMATPGLTQAAFSAQERALRGARALEELDELTIGQEIGVRKQIPRDAVQPNTNIEFTMEQKVCAKELLAEIDKTLYKCVIENLRGQARTEATNFSKIDQGYLLVQHMNFFYRGVSTATSTDITTQIVGFSDWFPHDSDPKDSLIRFQELNLKLSSYEGHGFTDQQQVTFILKALNENIHYHPLSQTLESKDSGSIKCEELISRIVRFYNDTHKGWGFDMTAAERGSKHKNSATKQSIENKHKKLLKKVNSMQEQIQKLTSKNGFKRKFNGSQNSDNKKAKKPCVICGKTGHLPSFCRNKPDGIVCFKCGKKGHKSPDCKSEKSSANASKKSAKVDSDGDVETIDKGKANNAAVKKCAKCRRTGHSAKECRTKPCPHCKSLQKHDWNECDGHAKAFFLCEEIEEGEYHLNDNGKTPENGTFTDPQKGHFQLYPKNKTFKSALMKGIEDRKDTSYNKMVNISNQFQILTVSENSLSLHSSKQEDCDELVSFAIDPNDEDWYETMSEDE